MRKNNSGTEMKKVIKKNCQIVIIIKHISQKVTKIIKDMRQKNSFLLKLIFQALYIFSLTKYEKK